jgi:hypothetical protein
MIYSIFSFKASGPDAGVFSVKLCSIAFSSAAFSSNFEGYSSAGFEGSASALAWLAAASTSAGLVSASICNFEALVIFPEGVDLKAITVSSTSNIFTILFLFGVAAKPFYVVGTVVSAEGLKISNLFSSSVFGSSALSLSAFGSVISAKDAFSIVVGSSAFCVRGVGSFGAAAKEVSPPKSGTAAGSM